MRAINAGNKHEEHINTERLLIALANIKDLPALEVIEKECEEYFLFDPPSAAEHNRSLRECLLLGDDIPGISEEDFQKENYLFYCIWKNDILVGWISLYLEYQQKDAAYLSVLYVKEEYRKSKIGAEVLDAIVQKLILMNYTSIRLHCSLRNATALRFWAKNGFDKIVDIECDGNLYPQNFGGVELMRTIACSNESK